MLMPSIFREDLFDDLMNDFAFPSFSRADQELYGKHAKELMKTDVQETENDYIVDIDLPGFQKEDIQMQLENGYLTIRARKAVDKDEKTESGKYVRRERYTGSLSRSFYVGKNIQQEDIHPKYENGILTFRIPKLEKKVAEEKHYISIEG